MFTKRQNQYNKLIKKELGEIFVKHGKEWFGNVLVTVTIVRITSDLSQAKVYLSVLPFEKSNEVLQNTNYRTKQIRGLFGNLVRHQVRHVPDLEFHIDDTADFIERIDKALGK